MHLSILDDVPAPDSEFLKNFGSKPNWYLSYERMILPVHVATPIVLFTADIQKRFVHLLEDTSGKRYVQCNKSNVESPDDQPSCILCSRKYKLIPQYILPVYDSWACLVKLLPMSFSPKDLSLVNQLVPLLREIDKNPSYIAITIKKHSNWKYEFERESLFEPDNRMESEIADFLKDVQEKKVAYESVFTSFTNKQLALRLEEYQKFCESNQPLSNK